MPRIDAPRPPAATPARATVPLVRALRSCWWALAILLVVALGALVPASPLRDAATGGPVPEASLRLPAGYVVLAPVSNLLDTLTLLSLRQHVALLVTLAVLFLLWWWRRGRHVPPAVVGRRRVVRQGARIGLAIVGLVAVYAAALLMPRPMAALEVVPDVAVVDFHAHTRFSHDGRWNWSPEDVRRWHRDAGYSAAYVTDHRTFEGARDAWANNPPLAGEGTSLLPGIEATWKGEHVNILDADRVYSGLVDAALRDVDEDALRLASLIATREPVLVETLPGRPEAMIPAHGRGTAGVRAIEIIDGSPKGLGQTRRERARLLRLADSLDLALVSGSDSHGWGWVAQGWTLLVLPQWRAATPAQLSEGIGATLRSGVRGTKVVERWVADTDRGIALPFTVPVVLWGMVRTLTADERLMWVLWTIAAAALWLVRERRRGAVAPA